MAGGIDDIVQGLSSSNPRRVSRHEWPFEHLPEPPTTPGFWSWSSHTMQWVRTTSPPPDEKGIWAWAGEEQRWVIIGGRDDHLLRMFVKEAPQTTAQPYARNGLTRMWERATPSPPTGASGSDVIFGFNAQTALWAPTVPAPTTAQMQGVENLMGYDPFTQAWAATVPAPTMAEMANVPGPMAFNPITNMWVATVPAPPGQPGVCANEPMAWNPCTQTWQTVTKGRTDGSNPAPGEIGEIMEGAGTLTVAPLSLNTAPVYTALTSVVLSPGDWDVSAQFNWTLTAVVAAPVVVALGALSTVPNTFNVGYDSYMPLFPTYEAGGTAVAPHRFNLTAGVTVYAITSIVSSVASDASITANCYGFLHARRMS